LLPTLVATAVAAVAASVVLFLFAVAAPAAAAHLVFAAGIMPLILGAMLHFVPVLTRSRGAATAFRYLPFAASGAGLLAAVAFFEPGFYAAGVHGGATLALGIALAMATWIVRRAKAAVGAPHPCLHWYLAATLCLALALVAALAMGAWPQWRAGLRVFHLHLNALGFIGLTALGTLQVLLPTAAGRPDQMAGARLRSDLPLAVAGVLLIAAGAAWGRVAAVAGMALLLVAVARIGMAWTSNFAREISRLHGAAPALALALAGLAGVLLSGAGHAYGRLSGNDAVFGFVIAFLLPLVTGAASQLLPLWLRYGAQTAWHLEARSTLTRFGGLRGLAFVAAGVCVMLGWRAAAWAAAAALAHFLGQMLRVFMRR